MVQLGFDVAFVARADELAQLQEAWDRARDGSAGAVLVSGDAGVGKTRLISEFAERVAAEGAVLVGHCVGLGQSAPPYLPLVEVLDQARGIDPAVVADRPALAALASGSGMRRGAGAAVDGAQGASEQLQLFDAVLGALAELAATRPVLLVIEDLHWSDPSMRDLLTFLLARMAAQALCVVLTYRSDDLHRQHPVRPMLVELARMRRVTRLDVAAFGPGDARSFARALARSGAAGPPTDEQVVLDVAARSEGNAFFAEELMASSGSSRGVLPVALADVLLSRIERLSDVAQRVARAASASGQRRVAHETLVSVVGAGETEVEQGLRECVQFHVLVPVADGAGSYAFRHALLREAVYADLLPGERARMHAAYVRLLADVRTPGWRGAQAYHASRANDLATALPAYVAAAAEASAMAAPADALTHLEHALALWDVVADAEAVAGASELTLLIRACDAAVAAGKPERAQSFIRSALPLADAAGDVVLRAAVRRRLAKVLYALDEWREAEHTIAQAWDLLKDAPPGAERAWVLSTLSFGAPNEQRRSFAEEAVRDARAAGDGGAEADALISLAYATLRQDAPAAFALLEQAQERAAQAGAHEVELRACFNLVVGTYELGQFDAALSHLEVGLSRAQETGLTWATYGRELRWIAVMVHYAHGTWDVVEQLASPPGEQAPDWISGVLAASAALLHASRGEFDEVNTALRRVEPWVLDADEPKKISGFARAESDFWQQRPQHAAWVMQAMLDAVAEEIPEDPPLWLIRTGALAVAAHADLAAHARQVSDPAAELAAVAEGERFLAVAQDCAERGIPRGGELGPEGWGWLARARAEASRLRGASDPALWRAAVAGFAYGDAYQQAIATWRLAEALLASGDTADGGAHLLSALATARGLRARPLEEALLALARRRRMTLPGVRPTGTDLLTPRERSVLELVARGLTNRAVGDQLFISEKTVSVHLTRVMAKLGARSRTEAVALALQRGLLPAA